MKSNDRWVFLDLRGLVMRQFFRPGDDQDGWTTEQGSQVVSPGFVVDRFVTETLLPLTRRFRLNRIIAVQDYGSDYRRAVLPSYKAHRRNVDPQVKEAVAQAEASVVNVLNGLGILVAKAPGVEADDILALLTEKLPGYREIHTVDNDLLQLAALPDVAVYVRGVHIKDGYHVKQPNKDPLIVPFKYVSLFKSIVGDSSDGYKGVQGVGPSAWQVLADAFNLDDLQDILQRDAFGELEDAIDDSPEGKVLAKLYEQRNVWQRAWKVAQLRPQLCDGHMVALLAEEGVDLDHLDIPTSYTRIQWTKRLPQLHVLEASLQNVACDYLLSDLQHLLPQQHLVTGELTEEDLDEFEELVKASPFVALDWETTDQLQHPAFREASRTGQYVDMLSSTITGAGFTVGVNLEQTFYFSFDHADTENLPREALLQLLDRIPESTPIVAHNAYFERNVIMQSLGRDLPNVHDTLIMASHVDENSDNGLKQLSTSVLRYEQQHYADVIEKGTTMSDYSAEHVFQYGADDPLVTAHLYDFFYVALNIEGTWEFVRDNEFPTLYVMSDAFLAGVSIDWALLERQTAEDQEVVDTGTLELRKILQDHQTPELIERGVEHFLPEYIVGKSGSEEEVREALREKITYRPYVQLESESKWKPTAKGFNKLALALGLPDTLSGTTNKAWFKYQAEVKELGLTPDQALLCNSWASALQYLTDKAAPEHLELLRVAAELERRHFPAPKAKFVGTELNLNSPVQNQILLYGMLYLPFSSRNFEVTAARAAAGATEGSLMTDEDAILWALANDLPEQDDWRREALNVLLKVRKASTRIKLFYNKFPLWKRPDTGQIHPQFNSVGTETRRPTGSAPNFLQLPKRGEGIKLRKCVLPNARLGHDIVVSIDFSQEELRFMAGLSLDRNMLGCYIGQGSSLPPGAEEILGAQLVDELMEGKTRDMHSLTAIMAANMDYDDFEAQRKDEDNPRHKELNDIRRDAKTTVFLSQYGGGAAKLSRGMLQPVEVARSYLNAYAAAYPGVGEFKERVIAEAHAKGYVDTLLGCRRHLYEQLRNPDEGMRGHTERQAVNYVIQGLAADLLKRVSAQLHKKRTFQKYQGVLIAPIYDELAFSCNSEYAHLLIPAVMAEMTRPIKGMPVPILAEASLGPNFGTQIELGSAPTQADIMQAVARSKEMH